MGLDVAIDELDHTGWSGSDPRGCEHSPSSGRVFPGRLADLDTWVPPWRAEPEPAVPAAVRGTGTAPRGCALLPVHPATCDALAALLGCEGGWQESGEGPSSAALLVHHPATAEALEVLLPSA